MMHPTIDIKTFLKPGVRAHLAGIGGVSMCPLAEVLLGSGVTITGSDMRESATVAHLRSLGIPVTIGHLPQSVEGADCVIRTAAVHDSNPEIAAALAAGQVELPSLLGEVMTVIRGTLRLYRASK